MNSPKPPEAGEPSEPQPPPVPPRGFAAWLWRRPRRWFLFGIPVGALLAFVAGIALTGGFFGVLKLTETDAFCTSCHEMQKPYQELTSSVHFSNVYGVQATCGKCHVPPTFFAGLWRHMKAAVEVYGHLRGELDTPAKYEAHRLELAQKIWAEFKANNSAECRSCHTPSAMAFAKQSEDAADAHKSLATSGMTCIDCHQGVAHTLPAGS
jgi:nitrate/TMAO reductase-like tetraheme cytochrome c subunit